LKYNLVKPGEQLKSNCISRELKSSIYAVRHPIKRIANFSEATLRRAELQVFLSEKLSSFPKIQFEIEENEIIQKCQWVKRVKMPDDKRELLFLLNNLNNGIRFMHHHGYIHGDILLKNICYDGQKLVLIDHELDLYKGNKVLCTYPWIDPQDLQSKRLSEKTDWLCFEATSLRLLNIEEYRLMRKKCEKLIGCATNNYSRKKSVI
jgi:serine/threonine protein kinase